MAGPQKITPVSVRRSVARAKSPRSSLAVAVSAVLWQIDNRTWKTLGYSTWEEMREAQYGGPAVVVPPVERPHLVVALRSTGLTHQAIANTVGVSKHSVARILSLVAQEPTRPGVTSWSRKVQAMSVECPVEHLADDELKELHGAATFLYYLCEGEIELRARRSRT